MRLTGKHAGLFVPTIVKQLTGTLPGLARIIGRALESDPLLCEKHSTAHFNDLLLQPMQEGLQGSGVPTQILIVMDALDKCKNTSAIGAILKFFKRLEKLQPLEHGYWSPADLKCQLCWGLVNCLMTCITTFDSRKLKLR